MMSISKPLSDSIDGQTSRSPSIKNSGNYFITALSHINETQRTNSICRGIWYQNIKINLPVTLIVWPEVASAFLFLLRSGTDRYLCLEPRILLPLLSYERKKSACFGEFFVSNELVNSLKFSKLASKESRCFDDRLDDLAHSSAAAILYIYIRRTRPMGQAYRVWVLQMFVGLKLSTMHILRAFDI